MSDPRGFVYELEPLLRKTDWDLDEAVRELAGVNWRLAQQAERASGLSRMAEAHRAELNRQAAGAVLDLALRQVTYRHLGQLHEEMALAQQHLDGLQRERERVAGNSNRLRKFADKLEDHRRDALRVHERASAQRACNEADDMWLQRLNRRTFA